MDKSDDDKFMRRCLDLASCAEGMTYPNPMVGSVIVHGGEIIGEGYHLRAGLPHAEVNAINSVRDISKLINSTLYVNLEPCSHHGKTPPCADLIIKTGIPRVVIGATDTSAKVNGMGIKKLEEAGVEVITGVQEKESRWLNRRFFTFNEQSRPWIVLKWAQSADCFIDIFRPATGIPEPNWISGKSERILVHRWRSVEQSILAGAGTIRMDDPKLNVREWAGNNPLRLILSSSGIIKRSSAGQTKEVIFTHNTSLKNSGDSEIVLLDKDKPSCIQVAEFLYNIGIQSLIVEGGAVVLNHFIDYGLWDEARVFTGYKNFSNGVKAPLLPGTFAGEQRFGTSKLQYHLNEKVTDAYFK
ncbi:MAG TPA: bifunctional diaminohydroxyphosphoribosylaminopyrimidine deaminase/5-amino-6-(5-phosphoribosylamino)uracil reductase RibD [Bacteroidales bacterium]|nr:bifunctional diaminohydroxyphosphoribosylaminopyrimidine deaminase/5-amino-6-(5-phosphoribosylamino)uracil reductase RibD [Bacteroidales bacterium]